MIVTLTGSNGFILQQELKRLIAGFVAEHSDMGLEKLDGEEVEYDRIRESLESLPFLASRKLVLLRAPGANKEFVENAEKLLSGLPESTDVIVIEPKLDKRLAYYKFLKRSTEFKEFNELDEHGLSRWLVEEAKVVSGSLSPSDARYLVERVGPHQQLLHNELQKLLTHDLHITRDSIDQLTEPTPQSTVFELLDAAMAGNRKRMLELYHEQRLQKVEPQAIIALLAWQLHVLMVVKTAGERSESDIAKEARLNPFVVRKTRSLAKNISFPQAKRYVSDLLDLDVALKTSQIDADDALQAYLLSLSA